MRADQPYRIGLRGLPKLSRLDIRTILAKSATRGVTSSLGGTAVTHQASKSRRPTSSPMSTLKSAVPVPPPNVQAWPGLRHENLFVARAAVC